MDTSSLPAVTRIQKTTSYYLCFIESASIVLRRETFLLTYGLKGRPTPKTYLEQENLLKINYLTAIKPQQLVH